MSAYGLKRTLRIALHISAFDPKQHRINLLIAYQDGRLEDASRTV